MHNWLNAIANRKILITGGTGSVGRELVRWILHAKPKVVRIFSRDEGKQFEMRKEFEDERNVRFLIGDVRDKDRLMRALEGIDVVFHLAAMKHVESCEYNPFEAVKTNIVGTENVIECALEQDVERVIFTSSDKAVNPANAMGASKLMAEKLITAAHYHRGAHKTVFCAVRFGNVLGSSGSVIPTFIRQLEQSLPLMITEPEMTRFFISTSEAVQLTLQAAAMAQGGEIFCRFMPAVRLIDLASVLAEALGVQARYEVVGLRPGEKMHEELYTADEARHTYLLGDLFIIVPQLGSKPELPREAQPVAPVALSSADVKPVKPQTILRFLKEEGIIQMRKPQFSAYQHQSEVVV
ncbi:MAG TPA: polysaccharide biosynthesis protein [Proteobacteria bacterium]|nr:polysaccharide biosynthesis protein [Pseudomonadota bacterium]